MDTHFYEPALGHGLSHDPFKAIIAPRPIGWVSTVDGAGHRNLAPYSFFNAVSAAPPLIAFSSYGYKDSVRNVEASGEFVWNLECRACDVIRLRNAAGESIDNWLVIGEVVGVHIAKWLLNEGVFDTVAAQPIMRAGGPADYFGIGPDDLFKMSRPS